MIAGRTDRLPRVSLADFIAGLPKAELHVHHVGSASPRIVSELAARHPGVVPSDLDELRAFFEFRDFAHFIEVYLAVVDLIRTPEDVRLLTYEVAREMAERSTLRYAELTCTPYTSVLPGRDGVGMPIEAYTEAIEDARVAAERDFGLVLRWIYDIPGEAGCRPPTRRSTTRWTTAPDALVGFGLGGPEIGVPRPQFQPHFDAARAAGLHSVPHAGETTGPRDGLGRAAAARRRADRPRHVAPRRTPSCSPTSPRPASRSRCARRPTSPPARSRRSTSTRCARSSTPGVTVTINSDDPPMFGTTLNREYEIAAELLDLDEAGVADLARAGGAGVVRARTTSRRALLDGDRRRTQPATEPCRLSPASSYQAGPRHLYPGSVAATRHWRACRLVGPRVA